MGPEDTRRRVALAVPAVLPASMALLFAALNRRLPARQAYRAGFAVYWCGWCVALPVAVLGPRGALRVLTRGRRPTAGEAAALLLPVAGAIGTELVPHRREVDRRVLVTMLGTAGGERDRRGAAVARPVPRGLPQ